MNLRYLAIVMSAIISFGGVTYGQSKRLKNNEQVQPLNHVDSIFQITPPLYNFYSKYLNCEGIAIRSHQVVDNKALIVASARIKRMLIHMDATLKGLVKNGVELHIIGRDQQTSDLPEFRAQKGVEYLDNNYATNIDKRTRGMGGMVYVSCGEENLLGLADDRYSGGYDICMHEFSHTVMNIGFDSLVRAKIEHQYKRSIEKGLWKGVYASTNVNEYWAELTTWYFGSHGDYLQGKIPVAGPKGLHDYDIEGYKLLDSIYSGIIQPKVLEQKASVVVSAGIPSGRSESQVKLSVFNNKSKVLKLYWIDEEGKAKYCETIAAHTHFIQNTFMTNVWMLQDDAGAALIYIKVLDSECELEFKD
jgi:hypothetical protein